MQTATDGAGYYEFLDLADGNYALAVTPANSYALHAPSPVSTSVSDCSYEELDFTLDAVSLTTTPTVSPSLVGVKTATPPSTATRTASATPTRTATSTSSSTFVNPTVTVTATVRATETVTPTATATSTHSFTPTWTSTPSPLSQTLAFTPSADAYVSQSNPTRNYGSAEILALDASPAAIAYLRFSVQGITGSVTGATLRVFAHTSSTDGFRIGAVTDTTWTENGITFVTAPRPDETGLASGKVIANGWVDVDVTSLVRGNGPVSLALIANTSTKERLASRESNRSPQLIITISR